MQEIRILHDHEPGYGWSFTSPDLTGLVGGSPDDADFVYAKRHAESAVHFHLECEAEERGEPVPHDVSVVHLMTNAEHRPEARAS